MFRLFRDLIFLGGKKQATRKSSGLFKRRAPALARELEVLEVRTMLSVTLGPGDIAFTGFQSDDPDTFSFVLLKTVDSSTALTFTDNGWASTQSGFANATEHTLTLTFNSNYSAGTHFVFQNGATPAFKTVAGGTSAGSTTGSLSGLSTSGDSILAYQGTAPTTGSAANWVAGINANGGWQTNPSGTNESDLPSALTNGSTAIAFSSSKDDGALNLSSVSGTVAQIRTQVNDISNWTVSDTAGGSAAVPPTTTFTITGGNNAPTGLSLSSTSIAEQNAVNATIGTFTTTDPDSGNTFTYLLVSGTGSADNGSFNINGNVLRATSSFDYETRTSYSIRVRTTDQAGLTFEQAFSITVTDVNESTTVLFNEIKANPPGSTAAGDKYQYIELRGAPGAALTNVFVVMLDGNGSDFGIASYVIGLTGHALGSNGLLMIKSPTAGHTAASGTTVVTDSKFDSVSGGVLSKDTVSFYLVSATTAVVEGSDYDINDDGVLDQLPAGFTVLDNVGWSDGDSGDVVYGGVSLTQNQGTPDAATRFTNNNLTETAAWFNGDLYDVANDPAQLLYDATRRSSNLPLSPNVASLTPGAMNFTEPPVITTSSGMTVTAGTTANVISDTKLHATDAEQTASQLTFTVTVLPVAGTLKYNNVAVVANVTTFTQSDISANSLTYDAPATAGNASFSFSVSDGTQTTTGTFTLTTQASTDTTLRIVSYNVASAGGTGAPRTGFNTLLEAFSQEVYSGVVELVDLFVFQEVRSQATTSQFIVDQLNDLYGTGVYDRGTIDGYTSGAGTQGVVYNTQTLQLVSEQTVGVSGNASRQTMRYLFQPIGGSETSAFYIYSSHLKASQGSAEAAQRLAEVQVIRDDADALGQGANIIYAGDFNVYTSSEGAYQEFLSAGNGQAFDPINQPGSWHNNSSFVRLLTQAPAVSAPSGLTSGGLDDRFDFMLQSGELTDGQGLEYLTGSYHVFGNNGSVGLNQSINHANSTALPDLANRTTLLDLLTTVSDHLPIIADFTFTVSASNTAPTAASFINTTTSISENTPVGTNLKVADITVTDDGLGTNTLSLSGADQNFFTIIGTSLYLKAGTSLNFETKSAYAVTVNVDDTTVGSTPDVSTSFTLNVTNVNEVPTAVAFTNTTTSLVENTAIPTDLKVADINVNDDALGTNTLSLSGADQAVFKIIGTSLYLKAGTSLNFETQSAYAVTVNVDDTSVGVTPDASTSFTLNVTNVNETPTAVAFTNTTTSLAENTAIPSDRKVADINVTDDALGANTLSLSGIDQAFFKIIGTELYLNAGTSLDFETRSTYAVTASVDDTTIGSTPDASSSFMLSINDVNDSAPVITTSASRSVVEGTTQVTPLTSTDADSVGTNPATFTITGGANMGLFTISGDNLVFNAARDFETGAHSYEVEVTAFDGVNSTAKSITVTLTDVNDNAPVITTAASQAVAEGVTQVALLTSTDADTVGTIPATFTITGGANASLFGISGNDLVFNAARDFETDAHTYEVEVTAFDGLNTTSKTIIVTLTDVEDSTNQAPTALSFTNTTTNIAENTVLGADLKVADITITDDALGTNTLSLSGTDQSLFKLIGTSLYLKAGTSLDFETKASYVVSVNVDDTTVGDTTDASASFTLNVTNINEAPTLVVLTNTTTSVIENIVVGADLKVADINITDDALGTNTLSLSGADQAVFTIIGNSLYLTAGIILDFEPKSSYAVTVNVGDTTVGDTPDASASFTLSVTDANDNAPVITSSASQSVAEGATQVALLTSTDTDTVGTNPAMFTITGGPDINLFSISGSNLEFNVARDFETDSHTYEVEVTAFDGVNSTTQSITVTLTDVNEIVNQPPTAVGFSNTTTSLAENTSTVAHIKVADIDITDDAFGTNDLSLSGADQAAFEIVGTTLYLKAAISLNFEIKSSYFVTVNVNDISVGGTPDATANFTLHVTNVNEAPTAIHLTNTTTSFAENTAIDANLKVADVIITDDSLGNNTLSLSGIDQNFFTLIGTSLYLKAGTSLDFETKSTYAITVNVDDTAVGNTPDGSTSFLLGITNVNDAPTAVGFVNTTTSVAENTAISANLKVADITLTDDSLGANSLFLSGPDLNFFTIVGSSLYLKAGTSLHFETKSSYAVTVNVDDTTVGNAPDATVNFILNVTNVNDAPTSIGLVNLTTSLAENTVIGVDLKVADINVTDDAQGINILSLSGADHAAFKIIGNSLYLKAGTSLNFETKSSYAVTVNVDDTSVGGTPDAAANFTLSITNTDEVGPTITSGAMAVPINENSGGGQMIYAAAATDAGDVSALPMTFSLGGPDAGAFSIDGSTGAVTLTANPNFETKSGYSFTVIATDAAGNASAAKTVTLAITNLDEVAPTITSGAMAAAINENSGGGQVVYAATATDTGDISATPIIFSLGGADAGAFSINETGAVTLTANPNFEAKANYSFTVTATDGAGNASAAKTVTLTIINLDEVAPTITSGTIASAINENTGSGQVVYTATAIDASDISATPMTFSLGGADAGAFSINGSTGAVILTASPNFEAQASYGFTVMATDAAGNASATTNVTLAIINRDEVAPTITSGATATAINENSGSGQLVYGATATDAGDISVTPLTFTLNGTDAEAFHINGSTGAVTLTANPDFETKSSYRFTVTATDAAGNASVAKIVTLAISDVNEVANNAPTAVGFSNPTTSIAENTAISTDLKVADINITDDALGTNTLSLGGANQNFFQIIGTSLYLKAGTSLNFEIQSSYTVTVNVDDATVGGTPDAAANFTLQVTNLNEAAPAFTTAAEFHVTENQLAIGAVVATDADVPAQTVTFHITGGADAEAISISSNGTLTFNVAPDYERPTDADGNHVYEVQITADDGAGLTTTQAVMVIVADENEPPQLVVGGPAVTWIKKQPAVTVLPELTVGSSTTPGGGALTIHMPANGTRRKSRDLLTTPATGTLGTSTGMQYSNGTLTLQIDLGPNVTGAAVQSFLRGIKFLTKGGGLRVTTRTIQVTLSNSDVLFSSVSQTINVRKKT